MQVQSHPIRRRRLLLVAPALLMMGACGDDPKSFKDIPDAEGSESFGDRVWNVIKQHKFHGTFNQLEYWFAFLLAASQDSSLQTVPLRVIGGKGGRLTSDELILIIQNYQYRFVRLASGAKVDEVVVAFSSSEPQSREAIDGATSLIANYLPKVNSMFGDFFSFHWLHGQLDFGGNYDGAGRYNMWLTADSWRSKSAVAHELVHLYHSLWTRDLPTFITEGSADLISYHLTGGSVYGRFATGGKVRLGYETSGEFTQNVPPDHFAESGNGFLFFKELAVAIGMERLLSGFVAGYESPNSSGLDILQHVKSFAGDKQRIEKLYIRWIADYTPASS